MSETEFIYRENVAAILRKLPRPGVVQPLADEDFPAPIPQNRRDIFPVDEFSLAHGFQKDRGMMNH